MNDVTVLLGLFLGFFVIGPIVGWMAGLTNPLGWMGVPPWRVPKCACPADHNRPWHHQSCGLAHPPRR